MTNTLKDDLVNNFFYTWYNSTTSRVERKIRGLKHGSVQLVESGQIFEQW